MHPAQTARPRPGHTPPVSSALAPACRPRRAWLLGWLGAALLTACQPDQAASSESATLEEARQALEAGQVLLFDVREPREHATGVAPGVRLLPLSQLDARWHEIPADRPVLLICQTQNRSRRAAQALREHGYTQVRWVAGGMSGWGSRSWPLTLPKP